MQYCHVKSSFQQQEDPSHQQMRMRLKKEFSTVLHLELALYSVETWTFRKVDQKYLRSFEIWYWRRMEKINWTDRVSRRNITGSRGTGTSYK